MVRFEGLIYPLKLDNLAIVYLEHGIWKMGDGCY